MVTPAAENLIERVHASGHQLVLSVTGGGSGAIAALLEVPGASASVLEAIVPYAPSALEQWLGGPIDQHCSARTARGMAMAAFERARQLSDADPYTLRGIGATASLATTRPKRGAHRVHVAWQSASATAVSSCELAKGRRRRGEEEQIAAQLVLDAVAEACDVDAPPLLDSALRGDVHSRRQHAPAAWTELLLGQRTSVAIEASLNLAPTASAARPSVADGSAASDIKLLFPGAFNPFHSGHEHMAEVAARRYGAPVTFELSIANVDKPPLDFIEIADRRAQLAGRPVLLTRAPTFAEKARLVPGCVFVVGADTLTRIGEPRYYGGDPARRDAAIATIAEHGCRFLAFGRSLNGRFVTPSTLALPEPLRALCDEVPEAEFHEDVSSSELRVGGEE